MEWISINDRLPEPDSYVLVNIPYGFLVDTALHIDGNHLMCCLYCENKAYETIYFYKTGAGV